MCEEDVTAKIVVQDRNNKLVSITEWVNDLYQFYRTSQALTPYYAKHNIKAKFYKLDFGIKNENCEEISFAKYLQMDLEKHLISISAKDIDEVLLEAFYNYINKDKKVSREPIAITNS